MVAGYTRQAAANIQPGLRANAEDINAEYNQLATAFDNTAGHDHSGSVAGDGVKIPLGTAVTGILPIANGGSGSSTGTLATLSVNPGGVLVGTAGAVPGTGSLTLNANTVAPPAGGGGSFYIVGADSANAIIALDSFGTAANYVLARHARGTAAAPSAVQSGDTLLALNANGYGTSQYGSFAAGSITINASQAWTNTATGTQINLSTTINGGTTPVTSLILQGNTATFSGLVNAQNLAVTTSTPGSLYIYDQTSSSDYWTFSVNSGNYHINHTATSLLTLDFNGNLTITGATATKASGTTWANPSARDLKENIQPYDRGLQAVLALNPCTWDFAADSGIDAPGPHIGLIHDETSHMPELHRTLSLGSGDETREVDGLDCSAVTWALVNAIKELKAELDALKAKLAAA